MTYYAFIKILFNLDFTWFFNRYEHTTTGESFDFLVSSLNKAKKVGVSELLFFILSLNVYKPAYKYMFKNFNYKS